MTLKLIIEHAPYPQRSAERVLESGDLSVGRGADCDWQIDDPDSFISRRHCVISGRDGQFTVTDASRGGLFLDGRDSPLGAGVAAPLEHGTRLRLGDVVIRAELMAGAIPAAPPRATATPQGLDADDFFATRVEQPPAPPRPESLPQPFERGPAPFSAAPPQAAPPPPLFDDPFTLDPVATPAASRPEAPAGLSDFSFGFDRPAPEAPPPPPVAQALPPLAPPPVEPAPAVPPPASASAPPDDAFVTAFFRGLGIDPKTLPGGGTPAEAEALGLRFRLLTEGLVGLLRTRAREKNSVRVAQTVIGAADVNPLKFLVTTEDALTALVAPRGRGYLGPEQAITVAFRDLSDHQMRTWTALQSSLRRMVDRFDPAAFEAEVEEVGVVKSLLTGNRNARLWQLYTERYRDIARSAEDRFLGEVGADFREAYEGNREDRT